MMQIGRFGRVIARSITLSPDLPAIRRSVNTMSKVSASIRLKASSAPEAMYTSYSSSRAMLSPSRVFFSSSTIKIVAGM